MNTTTWIVQGILAAMFLMAGIMKSTQPKEKLVPKLPWVNDFTMGTVRLIGISELLGAIGLIVPQLTGTAPILTPIAASGLTVVMVLAAIYHIRKGEFKAVGFNAVLLGLAIFVVIVRF
jgi:uncharacterized membrane protein